MLFTRPAFQGNNPGYRCGLWNTKKNTITLKQPNAYVNDENSLTGGTKSRSTFRRVRTKFHTKRTVINIVPTSASNAAFLRVMVGV
jgi:hypothetical protein